APDNDPLAAKAAARFHVHAREQVERVLERKAIVAMEITGREHTHTLGDVELVVFFTGGPAGDLHRVEPVTRGVHKDQQIARPFFDEYGLFEITHTRDGDPLGLRTGFPAKDTVLVGDGGLMIGITARYGGAGYWLMCLRVHHRAFHASLCEHGGR